jgi:very-short-patch-repair endonuclease
MPGAAADEGGAMRSQPPPATRAFTRGDLRARGWTGERITRSVRSGELIRARNGVYLSPEHPRDVRDAATVGGRLTCVSLLTLLGVFVLERPHVHVYLPPNASRQRAVGREVTRHWGRLRRSPHPRDCAVEPFDALLHAVRCVPPRMAVAMLDSALRLRVLAEHDLAEFFSCLPRRFGVLRALLDARAESGPESLVRLMLRQLGRRFEPQVWIEGVGRVDFLVDGWLIVECDSEEFHGGWDAQRRDRRRDQAAALRGYSTYRPIAEDILWHPEQVLGALRGLLSIRPGRIQAGGVAKRRRMSPARRSA